MSFLIESDLIVDERNAYCNPKDGLFKLLLEPYYVVTEDGQYLFSSTQLGRRPDRAFYMVPRNYRLGKGQKKFDARIGKKIYEVVKEYLAGCKIIVQDGIQGERGYETGLRVVTSIQNPHSAYIPWMGKLMVFPPKRDVNPSCFNYIVPERLPDDFVSEIKEFWPSFNADEPLTLYDFTDMNRDIRRTLSLRVDYFGGAFKKPNLTMVWNRGESAGMISYHAGCTRTRVLKGLSGTGKTTLTLGPSLEQDDAVLGIPVHRGRNIGAIKLIGLEAASFAKSEGLSKGSPEWPGLMASRKGKTVLCMNIDCENVSFENRKIAGYKVRVPVSKKAGHLLPQSYSRSGTTNGRFVFQFSILNRDWGRSAKRLKAESLSFKRFDIVEPIFRVTNPAMATALDSACESVITSAVSGRRVGERVRSYSATDFMAREQSEQALLKWKAYRNLGLGPKGRLVFFINNSGYVGRITLRGRMTDRGEKIRVEDSKRLIHLVEHKRIKKWIEHPVFGYLIPKPIELEKLGMKNFRKRFNPLNYYKPKVFLAFCRRDMQERTRFLKSIFRGQIGEEKLEPVTEAWKRKIPSQKRIKDFYNRYY